MSIIIWGLYGVIALVAFLAIVALLWSFPAFITRIDRKALVTIAVWSVGIGGTVLASGVQPVGLTTPSEFGAVEYPGTLGVISVWTKRAITAGLMFAALGLLVRAIFLLEAPKSGGRLVLVYITFFAATVVASSLLGTRPAFVQQLWYVPLLLLGLWCAPRVNVAWVGSNVKWLLFVVIVGSLAAAAVVPDIVFWRTQNTLIPGFAKRLAGLTPHPNSLGPLAVLYMLLEYYYPTRSRVVRVVGIGGAVCALGLSQSKTALVAAVVVALVVSFYAAVGLVKGAMLGRKDDKIRVVLVLSFGMTVITGVCALAMFGDPLERTLWAVSQKVPGVQTLTGRTDIWDITLSLWRQNPYFGYGPELWSPQFRASFGMVYVGQAHNQFVQTLGDSGLVGLAGLVLYLLALSYYAFKFGAQTNGLTVVLFSLVLARTVTETPLRSLGVLDSAFLLHLYLFVVLLSMLAEAQSGHDGSQRELRQTSSRNRLLPQSV